MEALTEGKKYFPYYREAYEAVLGGMVGEYQRECGGDDAGSHQEKSYETVYGL